MVVERDYVLTHIVDALARSDPPQGLVFKGGTALRLCFYEEFRYSADLDFSLVDATLQEAHDALERAFTLCRDDILLTALGLDGDTGQISYIGPLGRERPLKLDIAEDELVLDATSRPLMLRYPDQTDPPPRISIYRIEEIAAEKLRCVIQRQQCRDIHDLHRLFVVEDVDLDDAWPMFEEKARHRGHRPEQFSERLNARSDRYARDWGDELETHVGPGVPDYEAVMRELRRALRPRL